MNNIVIDLHSHSTISDGILSPTELVNHAHTKKVKVLALTDHDDIAGLVEAKKEAQRLNMIFVNGVEISVTWRKRTVHIVGLHFDSNDKNLDKNLSLIRSGRNERAKKMAHGLGLAGIDNAFDGAKNYAQAGTLGRIHFARYIVERGFAKDIKSVFKKYLTQGKPGYVEHEWAQLKDAVKWINDAGGVAVIAHPGRYDMGTKLYPSLFAEFQECGGTGVEIISGSQDLSQTKYFTNLANEFGLLASCGSDFHGPGISFREMGQNRPLPSDCIPVWHNWHELHESIQ